MMRAFASVLVVLLGTYLIVLAAASFAYPNRAESFLRGFAGSAARHYLELALRFIAGAALLVSAPGMLFTGIHVIVGWVLVSTTAALALLPWRLHHRFAAWGVPLAVANLRLVGFASFAIGGFIVASVLFGVDASTGNSK